MAALTARPSPGRWRGQLLAAELLAEDTARNVRLGAPAALAISPQGWQFGPAQLQGKPLDWQASVRAGADTRTLRATLSGRGSRIGQVDGELQAALVSPWALAEDQPWRGRLATDIADLGWLGELIGDGWQTGGRLKGEATLAGTPRRPLLNGRWLGEALALSLPEQGLQLTDGTLAARLDDNRLRVERLAFDSRLRPAPRPLRLAAPETIARLTARPGRLEISGEMAVDRSSDGDRPRCARHPPRPRRRLAGERPVDSALRRRPAYLAKPRHRVAVSACAANSQPTPATGNWRPAAPHGFPTMSSSAAAATGVTTARRHRPRPCARRWISTSAPTPGRCSSFSGSGLSARLGGQLQITARGRDLPRATGTIRTRDGRFAAYGQQLELERGVLSFQGLLDNPALDVRAVRKGLAVEPGVQIAGNARRPVVRLISDPELPDTEKLAWLVLGHGPEQMSASDATVLLGAAGGLLGNDAGNIVQQIKSDFRHRRTRRPPGRAGRYRRPPAGQPRRRQQHRHHRQHRQPDFQRRQTPVVKRPALL